MRRTQDLPPRAVLLTCDDDLRNTLTDMVPILQEHGFSCLFFVTGASLGEVPAMLWFEQLYLMFLASKKKIVNLDVARSSFRGGATNHHDKRSLWWSLVKHLSKYDASARQGLINEVRIQMGLGDDWSVELITDPLRRRFLMLNAAELRGLLAAGMCVGAHTMSHPVLSATVPGSGLERDQGEPVPAGAGAGPACLGFGLSLRRRRLRFGAGVRDGGTSRLQVRLPQRMRRLRGPDAAFCPAPSARHRRHESGGIRSPRFRLLPVITPALSGLLLKRHPIFMPLRAQAAPVEPKAANLEVYRKPEVVSHYASLDYLTACERLLFDTYLAPGMAILDLGVGGGRTTPYLSQKASRYVGVDYSEEMIRLCRDKFPQLEFAGCRRLGSFPIF